jgi:nucleoside 2-deoxyribosyltransferase
VNLKVYLSGPIKGLELGEANRWRTQVENVFSRHKIECLSPTRYKDPRSGVITGPDETHPLFTSKGIYRRDKNDTLRADLVFVNVIGATKPSLGTTMEISWAEQAGIPVVLCMERGNPHEHSMIMEAAGFITPDINQGIEIALNLLNRAF